LWNPTQAHTERFIVLTGKDRWVTVLIVFVKALKLLLSVCLSCASFSLLPWCSLLSWGFGSLLCKACLCCKQRTCRLCSFSSVKVFQVVLIVGDA
jgi:hypothetical protein